MLSLAERRILVTRARGQTSALATLLRSLGAEPILIPTIEVAPPTSFCALDAALITLRSYDWLILTSANAVESMATRARRLNLPLKPQRIAAIGSATARAIEQAFGRAPDLVPRRFVAEDLATALQPYAAGASMLLVRAATARDVLPNVLRAAGATVTIAEAYRNILPAGSVAEIRTLFTARPPDAITFTSASTAENLAALLASAELSLAPATALASIGPVTSERMRALNMPPTVEAEAATIPGLVEALVQTLAAEPR